MFVERIKELDREVKLLLTSTFFGALGASLFGIWGMALGIYLVELGFTSTHIGWIVGASGYSSIVGLVFSGFLADRYGRKKMLIISVIISVVGTSLFLVSINYWFFIAASALLGLSGSFSGPALMALIASKTNEKRRKYAFSFQSFTHTIGVGVGTLLAGSIPDSLYNFSGVDIIMGLRLLIALAALVILLQISIIILVKEEKSYEKSFSFKAKSWKTIFKFSFSSMVIGFGAGILIPWFPIIFREGWHLDLYWVGIIMTGGQLIMSVSYLMVPWIADKLGSISTIALTEFFAIVALLAMPLSGSIYFFIFLFFLRMSLMMMGSPISTSFMMSQVKPAERATVQSFSALGWSLTWSLSQSASGYVWQNDYTSNLPYYICAFFYLAHLIIFLFFFARYEDKTEGVSIAGKVDALFQRISNKRI